MGGFIAEMAVLADPSGTDTIDRVSRPERAGEFKPSPHGLSVGHTRAVHWLRLKLDPPRAGERLLLEIQPPYLDDLRLCLPDGTGGFKLQHAGDRLLLAGAREARAEREAESLARERQGALLAMPTHELKTPLAVIRLALDRLTGEAGLRRHADTAIRDIAEVIDRSRYADRLDNGEIRIARQPFDFAQDRLIPAYHQRNFLFVRKMEECTTQPLSASVAASIPSRGSRAIPRWCPPSAPT